MITLPPTEEVEVPHGVLLLETSPSGHIAAASADGEISVFSPGLELRRSFKATPRPHDLAIAPDGDRVALSSGSAIAILDVHEARETLRILVGARPASRFTESGARLWTLHLESEEGDRVFVALRDARDGRVLRATSFVAPERQVACSFHAGARSDDVSLWVAAGQDGQWIYGVTDTGDAIEVTRFEGVAESTPPAFNAEGTELLTLTRESLQRHSYPDGRCLGAFSDWPWLETEEEDSVGSRIAWDGSNRALVSSSEGRLYVIDVHAGAFIDEAIVEGHPLRPIADVYPKLAGQVGMVSDVSFFVRARDGRIVFAHGREGRTHLSLATLPGA